MKFNYKNLLLSTATTLLFTACGGENSNEAQIVEQAATQQEDEEQPILKTKQAKAQLGVLSGATVKIHELGVDPYRYLFTETTSSGETIEEIGNFNAHSDLLESDKYYLYTVSKGLDMDADDDGIINASPTTNKGSFHAIVKGEHAKKVQGDIKITIASELLYRKVKEYIASTEDLEEKLNAAAKEILQKDIDGDGEISNDDILQYNPITHKISLKEAYQERLPEIIKAIHEDRNDEKVNQAPIVNAGEDKSIMMSDISIELNASGFDIDGKIVSYEWSEKGIVLNSQKSFIYVPNNLGAHILILTVKDNDGAQASDSVTITVTEDPNTAPQVDSVTYTIEEDTQKSIVLKAKDAEDDVLTYKVLVGPNYGELLGKAPNLLYKPESNYNGKDQFIFIANDSKADSKKATVTINIKKTNDKPVIVNDGGILTTKEDTSKRFTLKAEDEEDDNLTYMVVDKPKYGKLTHKQEDFIYTPDANFHGNDSFIIKVNDVQSDSNDETIKITITSVNDAPTVDAGDTISTIVQTTVTLTANAKDIDGEIKSYRWFKGSKTLGNKKTLSYTPQVEGSHTISVTVEDDANLTATDRVIVTATEAVNAKPQAENQNISIKEDTQRAIILVATDDDDKLTYSILDKPQNGTLTGKAPSLHIILRKIILVEIALHLELVMEKMIQMLPKYH